MRRRDFLKLAGAAVLAPSLPMPKAPAETMEIAFDCATHSATATCAVQMWGFTEQGVGYCIPSTVLTENTLNAYIEVMEAKYGNSKATTNSSGAHRAV